MALLEDLLEGNVGTGLAAGIGMAVLGPLLAPALAGTVRPIAKTIIKAGLLAFDAGREGLARWKETADDLIAEVRAEMEQSRTRGAPARATLALGRSWLADAHE
jgi:hypothetical protein